MGTIETRPQPATHLGDVLFSKTRQRVLGLLYGKPDTSFYTNEIFRYTAMGRGTVQRELDKLSAAGLLTVTRAGNQRHYRANPDCPIYKELTAIVRKTFGLVDVLREALQPLQQDIIASFVYGSIAKGEETASSDIDLMVVADKLGYAELLNLLVEKEALLGRQINPSVYTRRQLRQKLKNKDAFITRVMEQPKLWVKGGEDDIGKPG